MDFRFILGFKDIQLRLSSFISVSVHFFVILSRGVLIFSLSIYAFIIFSLLVLVMRPMHIFFVDGMPF